MAKKKNYVTRDDDGMIYLWQGLSREPVKESGEWVSHMKERIVRGVNFRSISKEIFKAFIGNLPRRGTCREFKRGDK